MDEFSELSPKDQAGWRLWQQATEASDTAEAEHLYQEAQALFAQEPPHAPGLAAVALNLGILASLRGDPTSALPYLEQAVAFWEDQPPSPTGAYAFSKLGDAYRWLSNPSQALSAYGRALADYRHLNEWQGTLDRLLDLGLTYRDLHRSKPALKALDEAIELAEAHADNARLVQGLLYRGYVLQVLTQDYPNALADYLRAAELGGPDDQAFAWLQAAGCYEVQDRPDEAIPLLKRALAYYQAADEPIAAAACHARLGDLYTNQRQFDQAEPAYRQALALHEMVNDVTGQIQTWQQLAALAWERGQLEECLARYRHALAMAEGHGDADNAAGCYEALATLYEILNLPDEAAACYRQAAVYRQQTGNLEAGVRARVAESFLSAGAGHCDQALDTLKDLLSPVESSGDRLLLAQVHVALSDVAALCGDQGPAVEHAAVAQELYQALGLARLAAINALRLAEAHNQFDQVSQAEVAFRRALSICQDHGLPELATTARTGLALVLLRQGRHDEARAELLAASPAEEGNPFAGYAVHIGLGAVAEKAGDTATALAEYEAAIDCLDAFRLTFAMPELPIASIGERAHLYERVVLGLQRSERSVKAFSYAEEARSRSLLQLLGLTSLPMPAGSPAESVQEEHRSLWEVRHALARLQRDPHDNVTLRKLREAHQRLSQLWQAMGAGEYVDLRRGEPASWKELQERLSQI